MARKTTSPQDITIFDVAREAGVSYATVSRVINNKDHVRPEKREAVIHAMARLGYVANQQARSLAGGRSHVIGLLVKDMGHAYAGEIVRGIDEALATQQYDLLLYTTHRRATKETTYVSMITRGMADGLLLILAHHAEAYLASLRQRRFPYVLIDHHGISTFDHSVGATNWQGAYDATHYLLALGHTRIGFIVGDMHMQASLDRLDGYQAALTECGISVDPQLIYYGDFLRTEGFMGAQKLLALTPPPTAIFASNDEMAFGVIEASREWGLHIPDDLSIIGFDDIPRAAVVHPALTTVRQPLAQMGRESTNMLLKLIDCPTLPAEQKLLPTELVVRHSCQAPQSN
ncbi:MAG: LacI family DNA-binding transcriptional regulator [Chloroflexota bacterium]